MTLLIDSVLCATGSRVREKIAPLVAHNDQLHKKNFLLFSCAIMTLRILSVDRDASWWALFPAELHERILEYTVQAWPITKRTKAEMRETAAFLMRHAIGSPSAVIIEYLERTVPMEMDFEHLGSYIEKTLPKKE